MVLNLSPDTYVPDRSLKAKLLRRVIQWRTARPLPKDPDRPIVTFTFDDFPKSSVTNGASIVENVGGKATYYACSGLMNGETVTGPQYDQDDLHNLIERGHEIGGHTHFHIDCWRTPLEYALQDIDRNLSELRDIGSKAAVPQFAYPYGETTFALKEALIDKFRVCRGILPGVNGKGSDLMQLRALELCPEESTIDRAIHAIDCAKDNPKWVIIFTHDVRDNPSAFGTFPKSLQRVADHAVKSGMEILSMTEALDQMEGKNCES